MAKPIDWPERQSPESPERQKFAAAFNELLRDKKISHVEFAEKFPTSSTQARHMCTGENFPKPKTAIKLAHFFKVPIGRLLAPKGPLITSVVKRGPKSKKHPPPQIVVPLPLPHGAHPPTVTLKTFAKDSRFAEISIHGTVEIDVAMAIMSLVRPAKA